MNGNVLAAFDQSSKHKRCTYIPYVHIEESNRYCQLQYAVVTTATVRTASRQARLCFGLTLRNGVGSLTCGVAAVGARCTRIFTRH